MTKSGMLVIFSIFLFAVIGLIALFKEKPSQVVGPVFPSIPIEVEIKPEDQKIMPATPPVLAIKKTAPAPAPVPVREIAQVSPKKEVLVPKVQLPEADRIDEFFRKEGKKLPIVETVIYKSHVPWQKGRPAWLSDYASHYQTSRHFIARSLNGRPDYLTQEIKEGDQFNVLRRDMPFQFYLLVDTSLCKMWFYYINLETKEKVLLKTYQVGLGRIDSSKTSGLLTPLGKYTLGNRIVTYKPKLMGTYQGKKTEMITVFGTRWIPFDKEVDKCTAPAKGFGIHGTPWKIGAKGELADSKQGIGNYESDGCIRLATPDIEELFAIIVTKPSVIEIVRNFSDAGF